jgi:DNA-binding response OmpR family regulator
MNQEQTLSIVIVVKENTVAMTLADYIRKADLNTLVCNEADHALGFVVAKRASLVIIDDELPNQDSQRLIETIKEQSKAIPIILLTSADKAAPEKTTGVDVFTKPLDYEALVALVKKTLSTIQSRKIATRRKRAPLLIEPFRFCGGDIDPQRMEVTFPLGHVEKIGRKELGIIAYLRDNPDTVITRETLIKAIWGDDANTESRSLDQYIVKVRNLYKRHGLELIPFRTVHSIGYIYDTN